MLLSHGLMREINGGSYYFHAIPGFDHVTADTETMERFRDRLNELGVTATIRTSRGEDIEAACGMLSGKEGAVEKEGVANC